MQALVDITVDDILLDESIQDHVKFLTDKYGPSIMLEMIFKIGIFQQTGLFLSAAVTGLNSNTLPASGPPTILELLGAHVMKDQKLSVLN